VDGIGHGGLGQHQGDVTRLERRTQRLRVIELGDAHAAGHALRQAALKCAGLSVLQIDEAFLESAVVMPLE